MKLLLKNIVLPCGGGAYAGGGAAYHWVCGGTYGGTEPISPLEATKWNSNLLSKSIKKFH